MVELQTAAAGEGPAADHCRAILEQRPPLTSAEESIWLAFGILGTERAAGMGGLCNIPWSRIIDYAHVAEFTRTETEIFVARILMLDQILVAHKNAAAAKASK